MSITRDLAPLDTDLHGQPIVKPFSIIARSRNEQMRCSKAKSERSHNKELYSVKEI